MKYNCPGWTRYEKLNTSTGKEEDFFFLITDYSTKTFSLVNNNLIYSSGSFDQATLSLLYQVLHKQDQGNLVYCSLTFSVKATLTRDAIVRTFMLDNKLS